MVLMKSKGGSVESSFLSLTWNHTGIFLHTVPVTYVETNWVFGYSTPPYLPYRVFITALPSPQAAAAAILAICCLMSSLTTGHFSTATWWSSPLKNDDKNNCNDIITKITRYSPTTTQDNPPPPYTHRLLLMLWSFLFVWRNAFLCQRKTSAENLKKVFKTCLIFEYVQGLYI